MVTVLWVIGDTIDGMKLKEDPVNGVWLKIPSAKLRGNEGRNDNIWLRTCLERLSEIRIGGEYRGDPWGAVMVSEWHITQGGTVTEILVPPAAVQTLRVPETFAKIEVYAAYKLQGASRRLYIALADKKRLHQNHWSFSLDEMRTLLGVADKKSYQRWNNLRQWVLNPAIEAINDFGTVKITMTPEKTGRAVDAVRFDWKWKSIDDVRITDEENERHKSARRKIGDGTAPPLIEPAEPQQTKEERAAIAKRIMAEAGYKR